jgi:hypothetical protein
VPDAIRLYAPADQVDPAAAGTNSDVASRFDAATAVIVMYAAPSDPPPVVALARVVFALPAVQLVVFVSNDGLANLFVTVTALDLNRTCIPAAVVAW